MERIVVKKDRSPAEGSVHDSMNQKDNESSHPSQSGSDGLGLNAVQVHGSTASQSRDWALSSIKKGTKRNPIPPPKRSGGAVTPNSQHRSTEHLQ